MRKQAVFDLALLMAWSANATSVSRASATPVVAAVKDAAGNTANIAQGSYFSVYRSNLDPSTIGTTFSFSRNSVARSRLRSGP